MDGGRTKGRGLIWSLSELTHSFDAIRFLLNLERLPMSTIFLFELIINLEVKENWEKVECSLLIALMYSFVPLVLLPCIAVEICIKSIRWTR
jgi:hypothetical protein